MVSLNTKTLTEGKFDWRISQNISESDPRRNKVEPQIAIHGSLIKPWTIGLCLIIDPSCRPANVFQASVASRLQNDRVTYRF